MYFFIFTDTCPVLMRGTWTKGHSAGEDRAEVRTSTTERKQEAPVSTTHTGWAMKIWRRGSSQERPLQPSSSIGSENSYSEEPYINADAQSSVYAELSSVSGSTLQDAYRSFSMNTYSEIPDPAHAISLTSNARVLNSEGTYENAGYVLSEPAESSAASTCTPSSIGSASTPSSAYYSDVSTNEAQSNKKKKKKRKNEDRNNINIQRSTIPSNISSTVPVINSHIMGLSGGRLGVGIAGPNTLGIGINNTQFGVNPPGINNTKFIPDRELIPLALQLLPRHLSLERNSVEGVSLSPLQCNEKNMNHANELKTLPSSKVINNLRNCVTTNVPQLISPNRYCNTREQFNCSNFPCQHNLYTSDRSYPNNIRGQDINRQNDNLVIEMSAKDSNELSETACRVNGLCNSDNTCQNMNILNSENSNNNTSADIMNHCNSIDLQSPDLTSRMHMENLNSSNSRPLPPLPSRQLSGPQRRNIKQDHPLPAIPSEYI